MLRRNFLQMMAALPFVGKVFGKLPVQPEIGVVDVPLAIERFPIHVSTVIGESWIYIPGEHTERRVVYSVDGNRVIDMILKSGECFSFNPGEKPGSLSIVSDEGNFETEIGYLHFPKKGDHV